MAREKKEISKSYDPKQIEGKWYEFWMERGYFTPKIDHGKKPFVIIQPPPNVTGELHLGTALSAILEDTMTRWHRMKGEPTLWLPGTDHAGIAGQNVVEQLIAKEGLTRHDLGREKFVERVWEWMHKYKGIISEQHKKLGSSCDWTRERFTMDPGPVRAVRTTFVNLYNKGLIYRGERLINWCPRCSTALSDLEVDHKEMQSHLYYVRYHLEGGKDEYITVATTRPETILGDTAVAVNPKDKRFSKLVGRKAVLPAVGRVIPIIADDVVDPAFGTGAVKVTPAHDPVDFDIGQRHDLPAINILNLNVTMNENAGPYEGQDRFYCRKALLADLEKEGLLVKVDPYVHSVGHCQRCRTIVEPLISKQWFVKCEPLAKPAIEVVADGRLKIVPERFTKVYLNWMENIRDWCISRQLWWGHRIPVWYCDNCGEVTVAIDDPKACAHCGSKHIHQDPDVLDTWFSSGLWPHSTLGWPDKTEDLSYFYPTTVMETAYDIIFFWVARMIMMGLENTGEVPFRTVYLHGLIRDEKGEKMSKSRGNVVDPVGIIDKYGTDALRFALSTGNSPGNDMKLNPQKVEGSRNFCNKLWNATRFVVSSMDNVEMKIQPGVLTTEDRWILSRLNHLTTEVNDLNEDYQFGEALRRIYDFLWTEYCDWYIEIAKIRLRHNQGPNSPLPLLVQVLETSLRLLHPFMPFITEELWQSLKERQREGKADSIMIAPYPTADTGAFDADAEREMGSVFEIVRSIRNARVESGVDPGKFIKAFIIAGESKAGLEAHAEAIRTLARIHPLEIVSTAENVKLKKDEAKILVLQGVEVILPLEGMVDVGAEKDRLQKESEAVKTEIERIERLLKDGSFTAKAPPAVVEKERQKLSDRKAKLAKLKERLVQLS